VLIDPKSFYIGIDLAWSPENPSGAAVINNRGRLVAYRYCHDTDKVMELVSAYPDAAIGVDAPLIIPNATGNRPNEREFLKHFARYGLGVHAANRTLFEKRFARYAGFELYARLQETGFDFDKSNLYEVYPHATILTLFNDGKVLRYKASVPKTERIPALKRLQTALFDVITIPNEMKTAIETLKGSVLKAEEDFLDSLVCAYTLLYCSQHECHCFGNDTVGKLLTPKKVLTM
jgi:predicted RNase H-like nuclease